MARDEAMNETRGRGGVCVCWEEMSREEVWGGMCWWNDEREGEKEKEAQTEFFQAHTYAFTCGRA